VGDIDYGPHACGGQTVEIEIVQLLAAIDRADGGVGQTMPEVEDGPTAFKALVRIWVRNASLKYDQVAVKSI
jgi:hypothetical protein